MAMEKFLSLIADDGFTSFISTFGLAVFIVLYFIVWRDPRREARLDNNHKELLDKYEELSKSYKELENDVRPETRYISPAQATKLAYIALDRDLYKLYYYMCEKLDGKRVEEISYFIKDTILDTNSTWGRFKSPFPKVRRISDLYDVYKNTGSRLKSALKTIFDLEDSELEKIDTTKEKKDPIQKKKDLIWKKLVDNTVNMKREFDEFIETHEDENKDPVEPYKDSVPCKKCGSISGEPPDEQGIE